MDYNLTLILIGFIPISLDVVVFYTLLGIQHVLDIDLYKPLTIAYGFWFISISWLFIFLAISLI